MMHFNALPEVIDNFSDLIYVCKTVGQQIKRLFSHLDDKFG